MHLMLLVRYGESKVNEDLLCTIVDSYQNGVHDFIVWYKPYAFIEHLNYNTDHVRLREELESYGIRVYLITEPRSGGHHEVIFNRPSTKKHVGGVTLLQRLLMRESDNNSK